MKLPVNYEKLTPKERRLVREEYVRLQNGLCAHCKKDLKAEPAEDVLKLWVNESLFPTGFFKHPVHLHHNHQTGMTIGAIHNYCNAVLWQYHGE